MGVRPPLPGPDLDHVLEHTDGIWEELRGERLFVTGGTGFFGGWMLESLLHANRRLDLGASAIVLTRNPDGYRHTAPYVADDPAITLLAGDVRVIEPAPGEFSHVLHLATETNLGADPAASFTTAVAGTARVAALASRFGARLLLASSGAVYGPQPPELERVAEDYAGGPSPLDAGAAYGHGKRAAEFLCAAAAVSAGLHPKIARCFAFVGPLLPLDANFAIGNFIRDALAGGPIRVRGDGTPRRSYLYAADLAVWLWTILVRGEDGRPYNVGSDQPIAIADLARLVAEEVRPGTPTEIARPPQPGALHAQYVPSTTRATSELGLRALVPLREAVRRTAEWAR